MAILKEFREFALKGNVIDLAVGVIIGAAFGKIVNSVVEDMILPVVGIVGKADFTNLYIGLTEEVRNATVGKNVSLVDARAIGPVLAYGNFITIAINFLILAFCIFLVVKAFNTARKKFEKEQPAPAPAGPTPSELLLTQIRDELRAKK